MDKIEIPKFKYSTYRNYLKECAQFYPTVFDIPIVQDHEDIMFQNYSKGNILDIGAGSEMPYKAKFAQKLSDGKYYTMDTDDEGKFDFDHPSSIPSDVKFSLIVGNQVFEHMNIDTSIETLYLASTHLEEGGKVILTVPNATHPTRQLSEITHVTAWGYNNFYMLFRLCNLNVLNIYRYSKRHPKGIIERQVAKYVSRVFRMDWCDSIMVVAEKK